MIPTALPAPNVAPQASTAPATVVPLAQQSGLTRSVFHGQPALESQRSQEASKRRRPSEEHEDEGHPLDAKRDTRGYKRARLRFRDDGGGPVVAVHRHDNREPEEIDVEEFVEEARAAHNGRPNPGLVLDAYY